MAPSKSQHSPLNTTSIGSSPSRSDEDIFDRSLPSNPSTKARKKLANRQLPPNLPNSHNRTNEPPVAPSTSTPKVANLCRFSEDPYQIPFDSTKEFKTNSAQNCDYESYQDPYDTCQYSLVQPHCASAASKSTTGNIDSRDSVSSHYDNVPESDSHSYEEIDGNYHTPNRIERQILEMIEAADAASRSEPSKGTNLFKRGKEFFAKKQAQLKSMMNKKKNRSPNDAN